ncbi:oligosaccharide flippase family protein [uncultured Pseudoalteromonas sp.]|uniref:oligosaccharide flippase family protein n=1 Tax=uncultured Pseudoalteromonas sp. TaxID=114053 RepID=UPI0025914922|nr:oligosaccharide flippase family protein [uncultured Pseudoalteromonas sp.]
MSLKKNIIANYVSQLYVTGIGILILPLYVKYMGAEAYGLVGFFAMLQAWFALLDLGLTPTISRETARYCGASMSALAYRQLFRALSSIFIAIALIGGAILWLLASSIASEWLKVDSIPIADVIFSVQIMAISVALRWMTGLYRGVITGCEQLVWLSIVNTVIATLRFIGVFVSMWVYGFTPSVFFVHQLVVAIFELLILYFKATRSLPSKVSLPEAIGFSFTPIKPVLKFSLAIAFTSSIWVLVTQTDKLILSGILPLAEYGYFTMAVLVASGIMIISGPISSSIMPRMARLHAEGKHLELLSVYRNATQLVSVICGSAAIVIAFFAEPLLYVWTGDRELAKNTSLILTLYVIGNGFLAVSAFPYYLQYAKGNLRYHLIGNAVMAVVLIPSIIVAATYYGAVGAGYAWLVVNVLYLVSWAGYVHHKLEPGLHAQWLLLDIIKVVAAPALVVYGSKHLIDTYYTATTRFSELLLIITVSLLTLIIAVLSSRYFRAGLFRFISSKVKNV